MVQAGERIINRYSDGETGQLGIQMKGANLIEGIHANGGTEILQTSAAALPLNTWNYMVVGVIGGVFRTYLNATMLGSDAVSTFNVGSGGIWIGRGQDTANRYFEGGKIDSIAIWHTTAPSTWAEMETYITQRWDNGRGRRYVK